MATEEKTEEEETGKTALDRYHDRARTWTLLSVVGSVALALVSGVASSKATEAYQSLQLYSEMGSVAAGLQSAYDTAITVRDLATLGLAACLVALLVSVGARVAAGLLAAYRES